MYIEYHKYISLIKSVKVKEDTLLATYGNNDHKVSEGACVITDSKESTLVEGFNLYFGTIGKMNSHI